MRLPRRHINLFKHAARALLDGDHGVPGLQALHSGIARQRVVREVGVDAAGVDGEDYWGVSVSVGRLVGVLEASEYRTQASIGGK